MRQRYTGMEMVGGMKTLLALEPRILFDGAALVTGAEVVQDQTTQDQGIPGTNAEAENNPGANTATDSDALWTSGLSLATPADRREIVFIDTRVENYQTLMEGIDPAAEVILLDARRDGIEQIAEALKGRSDIDAIHLIGEGTEAELHLGTAFLTNESISDHYATLFSQIGQSLSADADLLIYGCNFGHGASGLSAIQRLADLTGADIAASTDRTGHVSEYGNWDLEVATGFIETSVVIGEATQEAWEGVLATYTVTTTTDGGAGSLRQAIINANANPGTDTITFAGSGTYLLTIAGTGENAAATGDLDITDNVIIIGNGVGNTIIDGGGIDRVFHLLGTNTATISGITIQGGNANDGGGTFVDGSSILNLTDAIVQNNTSDRGGGLHVHGTANVNRVLFFNNSSTVEGGAIHFHGADGGSLTNITVTGNTSGIDGGGLWTDTSMTITNSTFTLNHANDDGGGIVADAGTTTISNTIVSDNTATTANPDVDGNFSSNGFNLIKDVTGGTGFGSDITGVSANLDGLADNGGPTRTHALQVGSPAINAGTLTGAPAVDQRGATRDASVDIGAFEAGSNAPPVIDNQVFPVAENSANSTSVGTVVGTDADPQKGYSKLYWVDTDTDELRRINLDSSGSQQLAVQFDGTGATGPRGVTVDDVNGKVYWTNNTTNTLWRADLDGGNPQQLLTGLGGPLGITVDPAGGKIYWVDSAGTAIWHANLDGSSPAALITGITNSKDLTVDSTGGKLYWTDRGTGTIKRANLNGSTIETIVSGLNDPWGIALDVTAGKVYWSEATLNEIQRADMMVGATAQTVVTGANQPRDLTLDTLQGKIYWTAATTDRIESATFAGSPLPPVTATGDWPSGLAIGPAVPNLTYAIIGGNTGGAFAINAVSGEITVVNSAALDYETNPSFGLTVQVTDNLGLSDTATITINLGAVNEGPGFSGLDNTPTFTEGGAAVVLDNNATIADPELDAANNYSGATLTLVRNGGANGDDVFNGTGTLNPLVESGSLVVGGTTIGTVTTNSGGTLLLAFNGNATTARVNSVLQQLSYANSSDGPPATVQIDFTIHDGNSGVQGSGGALNDMGSITVTITPTNDPPTIDLDANNSSGATGNDYTFTFTEGDGPTAIADSDTDLVDVDSTTFASVKLAVSGLLDGNAETLLLDGDTFALATAVAGQDTSGGNYHVIIGTGAGTATVTITKQGGVTFTEVETENLIKAVQYQHIDTSAPSDGNRLIDVIVNNGTTDSAPARTTINVNPVNDPPTATIIASSFGVNEDDTYRPMAGVSISDIDAGTNDLSVTLSVNNGLLRLVTTTGLTFASGANDSATMTVTGTTTNLNNALATLRYQPDPDFAATDLLTLMVDDLGNTGGGSLTAMDTANIVVAPINDQPAFIGLNQTPTFVQGGPAVVLDNNATITDPELDAANDYNGATLMLVRNGGANGDDVFANTGTLNALTESGSLVVGSTTIGTVTTNSGGTLVLTFNNNATTALVNSALQQITYANNSGTPPASVQIDFTIDDGNLGSQGSGGALNDTGSITVTINATNIPPVAVADGFTVTQGSTTILSLAGNDTDVDDGLDLTSITIVSGPTNGTIDSINADGTVTYTHNGSATITDSFTYTINDLAAATSNTVTVSLVVNLLNVPPIAVANSFTVNEGSTNTLNLAGNDLDVDDGLDLTSITIVAGPTNGSITGINPDGTVAYTHSGSETLSDSFTYTINDLAGATSNTVTVSLTVTPQNDAPVAVADSFTVTADSTTILNLAGNDTDADDGLDLTSLTIVAGPTNGTIASINPDGTVTYTHNGSETLADSFTYTINDLAGATSNTVTVSLTVTAQNDAPIITSNGGGASATVTVLEGSTAVTAVEASDAEGTTPIYSIVGGVDAALFSIDPTTGVLTFITAPDFQTPGDVGADNVYDVIVQASDGTAVDTQAIAVTITQDNVPPLISIPPPPNPPPSSDPPPRDAGGEAAEDQTPINGGSLDPSSPGNVPDGGQGSPTNGPRNSDMGNTPAQNDVSSRQQDEERTSMVDRIRDVWDLLQKPFDITVIKSEIRSLLHRSGFLQDLDRVRDDVQDATATEQTYVASSVAAASGLSIGYVIWLLRSGVLLTALLSSVPAWQFVNPLLVLDVAAKKKIQRGQKAVEGDSVESLFEKSTASAEIAEEKTGDPAQAHRARWFHWNKR
jgi:predicted outer membrane repeat protein